MFFLTTQAGTPPSEAPDKQYNQLHIVVIGDDDDEKKQYFIAAEQSLILESSNLVCAMYFLLATHYIFNMDYSPKARDVLTFVQEKIASIPSKSGRKWGALVGSHFQGIC